MFSPDTIADMSAAAAANAAQREHYDNNFDDSGTT